MKPRVMVQTITACKLCPLRVITNAAREDICMEFNQYIPLHTGDVFPSFCGLPEEKNDTQTGNNVVGGK